MEKWISHAAHWHSSQEAVDNLFIRIGEVIHSMHSDKLPFVLSTMYLQAIQRLVHMVIHVPCGGFYIFWMLSIRSLMIL